MPLLHGRAASDSIRSLAFQFSEQLIFDKGLKASDFGSTAWTSDNVARVGLSTGINYKISRSKVEELAELCASPSGYERLTQLVGNSVDVSIDIKFNGTNINLCKPAVFSTVRNEFGILRSIVEDNRGEGVISIKVIK